MSEFQVSAHSFRVQDGTLVENSMLPMRWSSRNCFNLIRAAKACNIVHLRLIWGVEIWKLTFQE